MVKDGFAENQIAIRAPHKIMQCVVRILAAKAGEHLLTIIRLAIAIGVLNETHVRLLTHVHAAIAEFKGQWNLQVISKHCRFVRFAITISVLENHNFVVRFVARVHVRISCRAAHPHAPTGIPTHLNGAGNFRELHLTGKEVHLKARIDLESLEFIGRAHPFIGTTTRGGCRQRRHIRVINFRRHFFALREIPNASVTVLHHDIKIPHGRQKVEVAVTAIATASVVEGVDGTVTAKELLVLFLHHRTNSLIYRRCRLAKSLLE